MNFSHIVKFYSIKADEMADAASCEWQDDLRDRLFLKLDRLIEKASLYHRLTMFGTSLL